MSYFICIFHIESTCIFQVHGLQSSVWIVEPQVSIFHTKPGYRTWIVPQRFSYRCHQRQVVLFFPPDYLGKVEEKQLVWIQVLNRMINYVEISDKKSKKKNNTIKLGQSPRSVSCQLTKLSLLLPSNEAVCPYVKDILCSLLSPKITLILHSVSCIYCFFKVLFLDVILLC